MSFISLNHKPLYDALIFSSGGEDPLVIRAPPHTGDMG
jgi:hypothetical protein